MHCKIYSSTFTAAILLPNIPSIAYIAARTSQMLFLQTLEKDGLATPTVAAAAVFVKGLGKKKERKKT